MANRSTIFTRILRLVIDKASIEAAKREGQEGLDEATDPQKAGKNLGAVGEAWKKLTQTIIDASQQTARSAEAATRAIQNKIEAIRRAHEEARRLAEAHKQGAAAVEALKVTLAGENAARKLGANATEEQRQEVQALASQTEVLRQETEQYIRAVNNDAATKRYIQGLREARDEQLRWNKALDQGEDEVNALKVALAGEQAVKRLDASATEQQRHHVRALAEQTERLRQVQERQARERSDASKRAKEQAQQEAQAQREREAAAKRDQATIDSLRLAHDEQRRLTAATQQGTNALDRLRVTLAGEAALRRLGAQATAAQRLEVRKLAEETERARQAQERFNNAGKRVNPLIQMFSRLRGAALAVGIGLTAGLLLRRLQEYADGWKLIQGRLKLVTDTAGQLRDIQGSLFAIAQRTRSEFVATATLFQRVALNAEELGRSQVEILDLTETLNKAMQLGGANAVEARAGIIQFSQAMASGVLRGDEFRSMMENLPGVARALADGLDVPVGKLREMAFAGELTSQRVIDALLKVKGSVDSDFRNMPITISGAFQVLTNETMRFVGTADEATGVSSLFAKALLAIGEGAAMATEQLEKLNKARVAGGQQSGFFAPSGAGEGGPFFGMSRQPEEDNLLRDRPAAHTFDRTAEKLKKFQDLLGRLTSERIKAIVTLKAESEATQKEIKELNDLYAEGHKFLDDQNLSLQQRHDLVRALMDLGFDEGTNKALKEALKLEDDRLKMLIEARELGIATESETRELFEWHARISAELRSGNMDVRERLRLLGQLKDTTKAILGDLEVAERRNPMLEPDVVELPVDVRIVGEQKWREFLAEVEAQIARIEKAREDALQRRIEEQSRIHLPGGEGGKLPTISQLGMRDRQDEKLLLEELQKQWIETHDNMIAAAQTAAFGVQTAWQTAFEAIMLQGAGISGFFESLFRGMAGAVLGALAQIASAKVVENLALAFQALGMGWAQTLLGNVSGPAIGTKSAGFHFGAAALWATIGGVAAAGQSAATGGGGRGGGAPTGARNPAGRFADQARGTGQPIHIQFLGIADPKSPRFQELMGKTVREYAQRTGGRITASYEGFPS